MNYRVKYYLILFYLIVGINLVTAQSMYLDKTESKKVFSIIGDTKINYKNSDIYNNGLGISTVFQSNHQTEFMFYENSNKIQLFSFSYDYFSKIKPTVNFFFGTQHLLKENYKPSHLVNLGYYGIIIDSDFTFYPYIYITSSDDINAASYTTLGLSILFYDLGIEPNYTRYDDGTSFYGFKFYLWEFKEN